MSFLFGDVPPMFVFLKIGVFYLLINLIFQVKKGESELCLNNSCSMFSHRYCLTLFYLFEFEQNVRSCAGCNIQNIQPGDKTKGDFSLESF